MIGPPPPYTPPCARCARCRYVYPWEQMVSTVSGWQCRDRDACHARMLRKAAERKLQRSWGK